MPISFYEARQQILDTVPTLEVENVPLLDAAGRAVAENITAHQSLPAFDNSAMDGYAVRTADCGISNILPVTGYLPAGEVSADAAEPGTAVKIMTGAPLPQGADAVIPFENCKEEQNQITILQTVKKGDHIRWTGEDIRQATVPVHRRARVAILASGDELQEIDELPFQGGVANSNSWALAAAIHEIGAIPVMLGIARDNLSDLRQKIEEGLQADVLITSAGVSAGDHDHVREVLKELKVEEVFWKLKIKPGHPTAFGIHDQTPVFSLPGNPVSTLLTFEEFVRPALLKMMGHHSVLKTLHRATLSEPIKKKKGRLQIYRVAVTLDQEGEMVISSAGDQNTGIQRSLVAAQGIALLEAEREFFAAGEKIDFHFLGASTVMGY